MLAFDAQAWEDYLYFKEKDKKVSKRIDMLLKDCLRNPFDGLGKPERLKGNLQGYYSRRVTDEDCYVYAIEDNIVINTSCHFY